jgi:hypothetical protein
MVLPDVGLETLGLGITLPLTGLQRFAAYAPEPVIIANVTGERVKRPWEQGTPEVASSINHLPIFQIQPLPFVVNFLLMQVAR